MASSQTESRTSDQREQSLKKLGGVQVNLHCFQWSLIFHSLSDVEYLVL